MDSPRHPLPPILLIHGLWLTPRSWEKWTERYTSQGYQVIAPAWPGLDREVEDIRTNPEGIAGVGLEEVLAHYEEVISGLDQEPIIIGHSFGGALTQLLLDRSHGRAGVAISSAAVKGVLPLPLSTLRSAWPVLGNPGNKDKAIPLTPEQFHYAFTNILTKEESAAAYTRYHVPGSARVLFQGAFANFNPNAVTKVNSANDRRAPLLFLSGENDNITPPKVNRANWRLYRKSSAVTDYHEFSGRSHFIIGQDGWEEVADYALAWASSNI
ncbi:alpha/beta hydrolase (plasmid) [Streptomyces sp. AHU1]|uniref:alpha/beta hydrolase n=1 Tax=Streptomyces sp. AHU1 TaxID=3377215 RepID=UPI0038783010